MPKKNKKQFIYILIFLIFCFGFFNTIFADKTEDLKIEIQEKNQEMEKIQKEIDEYKNKIEKTSAESSNLKNQINILEGNLAKIRAEVRLSQNRIDAARLTLQELSSGIAITEEKIGKNKNAISETLRLMREADNNTLIEIILANNDLSDFFDNLNNVENFKKTIAFNLNELIGLKDTLQNEQKEVSGEKRNLENRKGELLDRQEIQKEVQNQKSQLLTQTKNQEAVFRAQLAQKLKKQKELEAEIRKIEEDLKVAIEPGTLPKSGTGVLSYPLDINIITQYFGNTPFATQNPQVYGGMGHNGVDFRASIGARVMASETGRIVGVGNTDTACKGVSYGKWVLVEHNNNLSTLYAHFSLIKVKEGDIVEKGQVMGYSGDTGYVTGPHLHFAVFASKAVKVSTMQSRVCGTIMRLPIAPYNGYLNPLSYL